MGKLSDLEISEIIKLYTSEIPSTHKLATKLKRFHKFGFGKSSLRKKYPYLDFSKTEKELTTELGYDIIWDCGLFKYELVII
jgi:hypothetical protein